ncbi:MAG TPA: serpin family protein [Xanthobacteraceae bacterium]
MTISSKRTRCRAAWLLAVGSLALAGVAAPVEAGLQLTSTAERLTAAQATLALHLVDAIAAKQPPANVIVSPASLAGALSVIERGDSPKLQPMLHGLLGFNKSPTAWIDFDALRRATGGGRENDALSSANAMYFDTATMPYPEAVATLSQDGTHVEISDFGKPEALAAINAWVNAQTKGRIPTILDQLPKDTGLVALNAVYFKDRWKQTFDAGETKPAPFHLVGGSTVDVPLMHAGDRQFSFRRDPRFVAVDLPYATAGLSLVVVTTIDAPAAAKDFAGLADWLAGKDFAEARGEIALPRFGASANIDLMPALASLGFKPPAALPGFAAGPLRLRKVQQRVELKVDEEGTEAAAATAVTAARSMQPDLVKMVVDKPFVFALRDSTTGLVVVAGYVAKPDALPIAESGKPTSN